MVGKWKLRCNDKFKEVGYHIFLTEFAKTLDILKVQGHPWSFDRNLFCIKEYDASLIPNQIKFINEPMWIHMGSDG